MAAVTVLSLLGFGLWATLDLALLAGSGLGRAVASLVGSAALTIAYLIAAPLGTPLGLPGYASSFGTCLALLGIALVIYSVFFEIPLRLAARQRTSSAATGSLVTSGTYALCRHPGALWMGVFLLGTILRINQSGMVLLGLLWMGLEILLVYLQDRVLFPLRFPEYSQYRQTTPFLVPTPGSIRRVIHSVRKDNAVVSAENLRPDPKS